MGNFGKSELHQNNVLRFVKALLLLAQGDLQLEDSQLSAAVKVKWVQDAENRLKVTGEYKTKTGTGKEKREKGTTKQALWQLVEKTGTPLELPPRQGDKSSSTQQERQGYVLKSVFEYLKELGVFKDERPENKRNNTRYWIFTLTLKHKNASLEENLGIVKQKLGLETSPSPEDSGVLPLSFWQDYCRKMLPTELSINPLLHGDDVELTLDDIVPLELVERKQRPQLKDDLSPDNFYKEAPTEYETPVEHSKFIAQALETGDNLKNRDRKIAVIGEPGAGKTTLLQEIAQAAEKTGGLPIFVRLADLGEKTLKDYLLKDWLEEATGKRRIPEDIQDEFVEQFKLGRVWLLLDGVDEISATGNLLSNLEKQLQGWVSEARIVLTCRVNVWDVGKNNLYAFEKYRIQPLSYPGLVGDFIHRFFSKAGEQTKGEKLIEKLERSQPRIRDLVKNPLRLTLLCRTWKRRQGELPQTKAELYKGFVETFYEWKDQPEIDLDKRQLLEQALGELAKNAIDKETTKFRLRESFVRRELDKFDKSLFDLACRVSWINHVGMAAENPDEPVYAFFHPTFQEYFAALAISDWHDFLNHIPHNPEQGTYRIFESQWKEVILLWLGREDVHKEDKERFINALVTFEDGWEYFYHYRAYFLAGAGIAKFRDNSSTEGVREAFINREKAFLKDYVMSVDELSQYRNLFQEMPGTADLQNSSNANDIVANLAILGFGYYEPYRNGRCGFLMPHGTEEARVALEETDRNRAISLLAWLIPTKQSQAAPNGTYGPNEGTQMGAAMLLGEIGTGNETAIKALEWLVQNAQDEHIRRIAVENLRKIDSNNAIARQTIINPLPVIQYKEDSIRVAESAEFALQMLSSKIKNFTEEGIRVQAVENLKKIKLGNKEAVIKALEWLIDSIKDEEILYYSAVILGQRDPGNKTASRILVKLIQTHSYDPVVLGFSERLKQNLRGRQYSEAVTELKDYFLKPIVSRGDFSRFLDCYRVIWHCVQNMTYPAFYQAWHQQEEVEKTTTPNTQTLNQADLAQSLQTAITNDSQLSQTIHLICIDSSQFIEPDNPAEIYDQMLDQNCPECDSVPETMPALKLYWNSLKRNSHKRPFLVLYASSTHPYNQAFFTALSKFGREICVITEQPIDHIPLKYFTPSQSIKDILEWIRTN